MRIIPVIIYKTNEQNPTTANNILIQVFCKLVKIFLKGKFLKQTSKNVPVYTPANNF